MIMFLVPVTKSGTRREDKSVSDSRHKNLVSTMKMEAIYNGILSLT